MTTKTSLTALSLRSSIPVVNDLLLGVNSFEPTLGSNSVDQAPFSLYSSQSAYALELLEESGALLRPDVLLDLVHCRPSQSTDPTKIITGYYMSDRPLFSKIEILRFQPTAREPVSLERPWRSVPIKGLSAQVALFDDLVTLESAMDLRPDLFPALPKSERTLHGEFYSLVCPVPSICKTTSLTAPTRVSTEKVLLLDPRFLWALQAVLSSVTALLATSAPPLVQDSGFLESQPFWSTASPFFLALATLSVADQSKVMKYYSATPMALVLKNPPPEQPAAYLTVKALVFPATARSHSFNPLFHGELGDYVRRLVTFRSTRPEYPFALQALWALVQSKSGYGALPLSTSIASFEAHARALSSAPSHDLDDFEPEYLSALAQFVRHLLGGRLFKDEDDYFVRLRKQEGSTSASTLFSRARGGSREDVRQSFGESGYDLTGLVEILHGRAASTKQVSGLSLPGNDELRSFLIPELSPRLQFSRLPSAMQKRIIAAVGPDAPRYEVGKVVGILERNKQRNITTHPAVPQHTLGPVQDRLSKRLFRWPGFSQTRRSTDPLAIAHMAARSIAASRYLFPESDGATIDAALSGDYRGATDSLLICITQFVANTIADLIPDDLCWLADYVRLTFNPIILVYPTVSGVPPTLQQNGQLMGHRLSFPILCIVNMYTYVQSMSVISRDPISTLQYYTRNPEKVPGDFNGDDTAAFLFSPEHEAAWNLETSRVGFEKSVGKNYVFRRSQKSSNINSPYYVIINSRMYTLTLPSRAPVDDTTVQDLSWADIYDYPVFTDPDSRITVGPLDVPYAGSILGVTKLDPTMGRLVPLEEGYEKGVRTSLNSPFSHHIYLRSSQASINVVTRGRLGPGTTVNLFIPRALGGLGLRLAPGAASGSTRFQARRASGTIIFLCSQMCAYPDLIDVGELGLSPGSFTLSEKLPGRTSIPGKLYTQLAVIPLTQPIPAGWHELEDAPGPKTSAVLSEDLVPGHMEPSLRYKPSRVFDFTGILKRRYGRTGIDRLPAMPESSILQSLPFRMIYAGMASTRPDEPLHYLLPRMAVADFISIFPPGYLGESLVKYLLDHGHPFGPEPEVPDIPLAGEAIPVPLPDPAELAVLADDGPLPLVAFRQSETPLPEEWELDDSQMELMSSIESAVAQQFSGEAELVPAVPSRDPALAGRRRLAAAKRGPKRDILGSMFV